MAARRSSSYRGCVGGQTIASITATSLIGWCGSRAPSPAIDTANICSRPQFRRVYDLLKNVAPRRCDHRYLEILELAAKEGEARVEDALRLLLQTDAGRQTIVNSASFREFLDRCEQAPDITDVQIAAVSLASFDQLFSQPGALQ